MFVKPITKMHLKMRINFSNILLQNILSVHSQKEETIYSGFHQFHVSAVSNPEKS